MGAAVSAARGLCGREEEEARSVDSCLAVLSSGPAKSVPQAVRALHALLVADDALSPQVVRQGALGPLKALAVDTGARKQNRRDALLTLAQLAQCYEGAALVSTQEFVTQLVQLAVPPRPGRSAELAYEVAVLLASAAGDEAACAALLARGAGAAAVTLCGAPSRRVSRVGLQLLARLAERAGAAQQLCDALGTGPLAALLLLALDAFMRREDVDGQRAALLALARVGTFEPFADAVAEQEGLAPILDAANDEVPALRAAAGYTLAMLVTHKRLRMALVKKRTLQLFVSMASVESRRRDLADCQRVAALGISRLCCTYHLRLAGAHAGALDAIVKMLRSEHADVRRGAAEAAAQMALVEDNSRRLCFGGALGPLFVMARSGDRFSEYEAVVALSHLAIMPENQNQIVKEGGIHVLQYLQSSADRRVADAAVKLMSRLRMHRLRAAAVLAGKVRKTAEGLGVGSGDGLDAGE